jgi:chorismate mutase-like protein
LQADRTATFKSADMAKTLPELRVQIDAVDRELLELLNRRAALANEVGDIKRVEGSPVFRPEREAQVIHGLQTANAGPLKGDSVAHIWREIMSACRALEAPQRVAFLGPVGTFSEQAALQFFGTSIERVPCASIDEVFRATAAGTAEFGVVPVENSTEGVVSRSLDLFLHSRRCMWWARPACWCATTCCARRRRWTVSRSCWRTRRRWPSARAGSTTCPRPNAAPSPAMPKAPAWPPPSELGRHRQRARSHRIRPAHRWRTPSRTTPTTAPALP